MRKRQLEAGPQGAWHGLPMRIAILALLALAAFAVAGCSSADPADNPEGDQNAVIKVSDGNFNPTTKNILVDSAVRWTNDGAGKHTVTADDGSFDSGDLAAGASWDHEFDEAGNYPYHCKYHASMKGTIHVG